MRLFGFSLLKLLRYLREELTIVLGTAAGDSVLPPRPMIGVSSTETRSPSSCPGSRAESPTSANETNPS